MELSVSRVCRGGPGYRSRPRAKWESQGYNAHDQCEGEDTSDNFQFHTRFLSGVISFKHELVLGRFRRLLTTVASFLGWMHQNIIGIYLRSVLPEALLEYAELPAPLNARTRELLLVTVTACSSETIDISLPHSSHHSRIDLPRCLIMRSCDVWTVIALVLLILRTSPKWLARRAAIYKSALSFPRRSLALCACSQLEFRSSFVRRASSLNTL